MIRRNMRGFNFVINSYLESQLMLTYNHNHQSIIIAGTNGDIQAIDMKLSKVINYSGMLASGV